MTNLDATPMPAGLGFHPYFPLDETTRLSFRADQVWLADETMLPTDTAPAGTFGDWSTPHPLSGSTLIDNCYAGWNGAAAIERGDARISLSADAADWLHLYRPPDRDFFCIEPVTHMPDAINRAAPMPTLAPGESTALTMTITWEGL